MATKVTLTISFIDHGDDDYDMVMEGIARLGVDIDDEETEEV
jgi:hypothetical protein